VEDKLRKMNKKKGILVNEYILAIYFIFFILLITMSLPLVSASNPIGYLDSATASSISGWACDQDAPSQSIDVHIYFDGPAGSGSGVNIGPANLASGTAGTGVYDLCG
jgi:hypothetical protein